MKILHKELYPGNSGETFIIRVIDNNSYLQTEISLLYIDKWGEQEVRFRKDKYPANASLDSLIEISKEAVRAIRIFNKDDPK